MKSSVLPEQEVSSPMPSQLVVIASAATSALSSRTWPPSGIPHAGSGKAGGSSSAVRPAWPVARRIACGLQQGFTLVEVLVALTIVAIALMACLRAVGSITASSSDLRSRTLAQWSAENRLTEIRVRSEFPSVGRRNYPCPQGDLQLVCQEDVYTTANPNFRRIEIQVYDSAQAGRNAAGAMEGGRLARLLGFAVLDPTARQ